MKFLNKIPLFFFGGFYPSKIYGKENVPDGSAVIVCNHFMALDCAFVLKAHRDNVYFLAKNELFKKKWFAKIIKSYGAIPIDRDNPDMKSIIAAIKILKSGNKLTIFPEGTRNRTGTNELQEIKGGSVVFAVKAKCPIVPMMIYKKPKLFTRAHIIVGEPFTLDEFYGVKLTDDVINEMDKIVSDKMKNEHAKLIKLIENKKHRKNRKKEKIK
jgi:1-acyl-sn-glycerol-3-phosphate acyltransferase